MCLTCTARFDGEPLAQAIHWVSLRVAAIKLGVGAVSTLVGIVFSLFFLFFLRSGVIGGLISAAFISVSIAIGTQLTKLLLSRLAPYWISRAQERFGLHDEVLRELRIVLR